MREIERINDLNSILKTNRRVLALFYASWCPFCRSFLLIFEKYAEENDAISFLPVKIDDETNPLWVKYRIEVVPTVIFFNGGRVTARLDGTLGRGLSEEQFKDFFKSER
jgi:thioredoxin 1